ncbi:MAG: gamma carbonic anhydrase family protein [Myxococcales bacterium]|nr:gamma carbonic anhydrase family protein [Myxococcales bacterium]
MHVLAFGEHVPRLAAGVFVAPTAVVIGDVELAEGSSIWFGTVLRADVGPIRIGRRSNVQDLCCLHMTGGLSDVVVGDDVTVGHGAILHGCRVGDGCLVGMGSILLDNVVVGEGSLVAAGALCPPRMIVPPRSLVRGSPAKVVREVTEAERRLGPDGAVAYLDAVARYRARDPRFGWPGAPGGEAAGRGAEEDAWKSR